jgi:serine/threonine-protein kinase RsbW
MRISLHLNLPREADSVPAVRRLLRCALAVLHIDRQSGEDLEIALSEACANVVKHAAGADTIEVADNGAGFDADAVAEPDTVSDRGRGLFLIKALSDNVRMQSTPRRGSLIHFEKSFATAP